MALFGNNYDRGFSNRGGAQGQNRGMVGRAGEGLRQGWDRLENGVRGALNRDHHDQHQGGWHGGAQGGGNWGREQAFGGSGYSREPGIGNQGFGNPEIGNRDFGDRADRGFGGTGYGAGGRGMEQNESPGSTWDRTGSDVGGYRTGSFGNTGYNVGGYGAGSNMNYDRDYGYNQGAYGSGGLGGGSMRGGWNRMENGARDAFDTGGYDRDYGGRHGASGNGMMGGTGRGMGYDRDYGGAGRGYTGMGYDRSNAGSMGYDRDMKSRSQTDAGDPFGDRSSHTPIRMLRGPYRGGMGIDYDRQYKEGVGDDPYYNQNDLSSGGMYRGSGTYDRNFRDRNDRGWF